MYCENAESVTAAVLVDNLSMLLFVTLNPLAVVGRALNPMAFFPLWYIFRVIFSRLWWEHLAACELFCRPGIRPLFPGPRPSCTHFKARVKSLHRSSGLASLLLSAHPGIVSGLVG